mgnify:CR=1 FL=1
MIRTVVAEDSATFRQFLVEVLESDPELSVVAEAANGAEAVEQVVELAPDLVVMDINMPVLDGLEATRQIMVHSPTPILIVSASANQHQLELSLSATQAGALHVLPKPESPGAEGFHEQCEQLVTMAKAMAQVKVVRRWDRGRMASKQPPVRTTEPPAPVEVIAIAASTGGPAALRAILNGLPADFAAPILVVQHISRGFVRGVAEWLDRETRLRVKVAQDGERLAARTVYVAPDDRHLGMTDGHRVELANAPPVGGFRPSATHLFASVARVAGASAAGIVLTGMGSDGAEGLRALYAAGGRVIVQDMDSSVVYGMAQEAVRLGVVDRILPLDEIGPKLVDLVSVDAR